MFKKKIIAIVSIILNCKPIVLATEKVSLYRPELRFTNLSGKCWEFGPAVHLLMETDGVNFSEALRRVNPDKGTTTKAMFGRYILYTAKNHRVI